MALPGGSSTKQERRNFIREERERFQKLDEMADDEVAGLTESGDNNGRLKSLRRPNSISPSGLSLPSSAN